MRLEEDVLTRHPHVVPLDVLRLAEHAVPVEKLLVQPPGEAPVGHEDDYMNLVIQHNL